jgi:hypothetical protein
LDQQKSIIFKLIKFQLKALAMLIYENTSYSKKFQEALKDNPFVENNKIHLYTNEINEKLEFKDGFFYFKGLLYVPPGPIQLKMIRICYNFLKIGYFGLIGIIKLISRDFWWRQM